VRETNWSYNLSHALCYSCRADNEIFGNVDSAQRQMLADKSPQSLLVRVHSDGSCEWWPMFFFSESRCPIDVTWFPFDEQICEINYESYTLSTNHMNMTALSHTAVRSQEYKDTGEWELLGTYIVCLREKVSNNLPHSKFADYFSCYCVLISHRIHWLLIYLLLYTAQLYLFLCVL